MSEQLKFWKEFEFHWPEYDVLQPYERYDRKLLLLTKVSLNHGIINAKIPNVSEQVSQVPQKVGDE